MKHFPIFTTRNKQTHSVMKNQNNTLTATEACQLIEEDMRTILRQTADLILPVNTTIQAASPGWYRVHLPVGRVTYRDFQAINDELQHAFGSENIEYNEGRSGVYWTIIVQF
jgi:hypothetical protein